MVAVMVSALCCAAALFAALTTTLIVALRERGDSGAGLM